MKYFTQIDIYKNAIKPATYIHIVCGCEAQFVLPQTNNVRNRPYYRDVHGNYVINTDVHPTEKQIKLLQNFGVTHTRGLDRKQASKLISIILERDKKGLALPWQLQIITKDCKKMSIEEKHYRYSTLTKTEAGSIIENISQN